MEYLRRIALVGSYIIFVAAEFRGRVTHFLLPKQVSLSAINEQLIWVEAAIVSEVSAAGRDGRLDVMNYTTH